MALEDMNDIEVVSIGLVAGVVSILVALVLAMMICNTEVANAIPEDATQEQKTELERQYDAVERLMDRIASGAQSFLLQEYKYLAGFCAVMAIVIALVLLDQQGDSAFGAKTMASFLVGAICSGAAGFAGMMIATATNGRTAVQCTNSMKDGLAISFASGAVMSNVVVGLGMVGLSAMYMIFKSDGEFEDNTWNYLSGFGFGASAIALFARVGGGVFTKAADVGADLTSKVEHAIPEDDPRNPATIADNVGDNVGDVAGMGADLFESFVGSIIAAGTLATTQFADQDDMDNFVALPFWVAGFGMFMAIVGVMVVRWKPISNEATLDQLLWQLNTGLGVSSILTIITTIIACNVLFDGSEAWELFGCVVIGLAAGVIIGQFTEFCTSYERFPTRGIAAASEFGPAPVIIKGMGVGMISVTVPTLALAITILACDALAGLYGVALSAVGLLSTLGITLATDAYGPVADNAGGIAEMAGLPAFVRVRTDALDSLGNTTAATGKGFAIGSAVLTSVGLIAAFLEQSGLTDLANVTSLDLDADTTNVIVVDLRDPIVLTGVLLGAMLPFVFAALTMLSVDKSARSIIREVRLQFAECPELFDLEDDKRFELVEKNGKQYPDPNMCVAIATTSAVQEMILPGTIAVFAPVIVGFLLGVLGLAGLLVGALSAGFMLALTMANAGGAWDNAKKWVERCATEGEPIIDENGNETVSYKRYGIKKASVMTEYVDEHNDEKPFDIHLEEGEDRAEKLEHIYHECHEPAVIGDTVGDPYKDTSGPSLNILIKLMSVVSLVIAPALDSLGEQDGFGSDGWWIALIVFIVVSLVCIVLMRQINISNEEKERDANAKLKAAHDRNRNGGAAGAAAEAGSGDAEKDEEQQESGENNGENNGEEQPEGVDANQA